MATAIQFRRGTTAQHANFTGLVGEITVDTDLSTIRVHDGSIAGGTRLATFAEVTAAASGDITAVVAGSGLTGGSETGNATLAIDYENLSGNLIPSANNTYSLGSLTSVWKDVFVGPGSLYVNGQKVLEDNAGTIQFSADTNQNISILTTGSGDVEIQSGGDIQIKSNIVLSTGKVISVAGGGSNRQTSNINMDSNNINNLADPVLDQDAATKAYVDQVDTDAVGEASNLYFTEARARGAIGISNASGDGSIAYNSSTGIITYTGPSAAEAEAQIDAYITGGDGIDYASGTIDVDSTVVRTSGTQSIAGQKTFSDDMVISGNLTISGTQTIVNSTVTSLADSIIELNRDADGAPSENAGLSVNRGSSADVVFQWNETSDYWEFTNNGSTYTKIAEDTDDLSEGATNLYFTTARAELSANSAIANNTTDNLVEGSTNLYYTDARARGAVSVTDNGGDGALSYNSSTGVISYTGPSASEVRAHFSAGTGVGISSGVISIGQSVGTGDSVSFSSVSSSFAGDLTGDVTGTVSDISNHDTGDLTEGTNLYYTDARARAALSGGTGITYNSSTGAISLTDTGYVTGVTAGAGLTGGGTDGTVTVNVGAGNGISVAADAISVDMSVFDTDDVAEGTNLYYTDARARAAISEGSTQLAYNSTTGVLTYTQGDTDTVAEGSSNLYHTTARARAAISASGDISYNSTTGVISYSRGPGDIEGVTAGNGLTGGGATGTVTLNIGGGTGISVAADAISVDMGAFDTDDVAEGSTNLYHTTARARGAVSGGTGISYNSSTGVISLTDTGYVTGVTAGTGLTGGGTDGTVTLNVSGLTVAEIASGSLQTGSESFVDSDTVLMTAAAVNDRIQAFGYTTNVGDITGVTAGTNLNGGGASGSVTVNLDTTLTGMTAATFSGTVTAGLFSGTATSARYADVAEKYATDADIEPGTVVCFGGEAEVTACAHEADHRVAGVISTDPAYMMNSEAEGQYVALTGRVPCKVTGPVAKGDLMVSSSVPGHAKADNNAGPGRIIGKAIGSSEGGETVIEVLVNMM